MQALPCVRLATLVLFAVAGGSPPRAAAASEHARAPARVTGGAATVSGNAIDPQWPRHPDAVAAPSPDSGPGTRDAGHVPAEEVPAAGAPPRKIRGLPPFYWTVSRGPAFRRQCWLFGLGHRAEDRRRPEKVHRWAWLFPLWFANRWESQRGPGRPPARRLEVSIPLLLGHYHSNNDYGGFRRLDLLWIFIRSERGRPHSRTEYVRRHYFLPFYNFERTWRVEESGRRSGLKGRGPKIPSSEEVRFDLLHFLYSYKRSGLEARRWWILAGLVRAERRGPRKIFSLLWGLYRRESAGGKRLHRILWAFRRGPLEPLKPARDTP